MVTGENTESSGAYQANPKIYAGIALLSALYLADILQKASRKCFWFDELFTVYLCRLPDTRSIWTAVLHGADFNPPLVHLLTRGAQALFGEGLIATRLPAIAGVWLFCICIFFFVARRVGPLPGLIAGIFPFFTLVQYYAYEARSHGIVLGWFGLTLLCWQRNAEGRSRGVWLAGFGIALLGALLTHVYAVYILFPFLLVEIYNLLYDGRPNWGLVAVATSALAAVIFTVYVPMFRMYRATVPPTFFAASHDQVQRFLVAVLGPAIGVLLVALALFALEAMQRARPAPLFAAIPQREMLLALGLACIPFVGLVGSKVSHGPFIERYFLSSIAGYAIFLGFASARAPAASWSTRALAVCMVLLLLGDLLTTTYLGMKNRVVLLEPSAGIALGTDPTYPMRLHESVLLDKDGLDVIVLRQLDYLYFVRYAPADVIPRLSFGAPPKDLFLEMLDRLALGARLNLKTTTFARFLASHDRFLAYGSADSHDLQAMQTFAAAGYTLKSVRTDGDGVMYEYEK